jgi:hypothetical protein
MAMTKSSRRRKEDRAKGEAKRAEQSRLRARGERERQRSEDLRRLRDPSTSLEEVADLLSQDLTSPLESLGVGRGRQVHGARAEDLTAIARLMLERAPQPYGNGVLAFAALAAHESGDEEAEHRYTGELLARVQGADDARLATQACLVITDLGHPGEAVAEMESRLRLSPRSTELGDLYGMFLAESRRRLLAGSGEAEQAALARFADRSALDALREAVASFLERTSRGEAIRERAEGELKTTISAQPEAWNWPDADRAAAIALATEIQLISPDPGAADVGRDDVRVPLTAFAEDPQVPADLARLATDWAGNAVYGVWQFGRDTSGEPGVHVVELITGIQRYAEFPASLLEGAAPWSAWLGGLVPVDGTWRCTGSGLWLSPPEADAVAEFGNEMCEWSVAQLAGGPDDAPPAPRGHLRIGQATPYGVYADYPEPVNEDMGLLVATLAARTIPWAAGQVLGWRSQMPVLMTTEDDPMLLIEATLTVTGTGDLARRLRAHPSFGIQHAVDEGPDGTSFTWFGDAIPGGKLEPATGEPERYTWGRVTVSDGLVKVSVNSERRFNRLLRVLSALGGSPVATSQTRVDPAREWGWAPPQWFARGSAGPLPGWEKTWLATSLPALHGLTPSQAIDADDEEALPRLESILRQFEHEAACAVAAGKPGVDVDWLRSELAMPAR